MTYSSSAKPNPPPLQALVDAFKEFTKCSGLKANLDKSHIIFGGDCDHIQQECLNITGFSEGHLPFKHLRMPITSSKLSKIECRLLTEKITAKVLDRR